MAHLGFFHNEFVLRRRWLDEPAYADLVSLCQFLPGPASSQVGMAIGFSRAGKLGAVAAWLGFTLPSAIFLTLFALGISFFTENLESGWLHALKIVAVAVVAQAIMQMSAKLCVGFTRSAIAFAAGGFVYVFPTTIGQLGAIFCAGILGRLFLHEIGDLPHAPLNFKISNRSAILSLTSFVLLLIALPIVSEASGNLYLRLFDSFFRVGALVFGGGHVVLPMLQAEVGRLGVVGSELFLAGYGVAQAIPGPLFSFAAYLGALVNNGPVSLISAAICLVAIFLPSFLLLFGILPFWEKARKAPSLKAAMQGINAAVVGLLIAAFINPVWSGAIFSLKDFLFALLVFLLLVVGRWAAWQVVALSVVIGAVIF